MEWCTFDRNRRMTMMTSNDMTELDGPVRHKFLSLFRSHGLESQEAQEQSSLPHPEDKSSNPLTPNETKLRVHEPTSSTIPRPIPDSNTVHLLCVVSGTVHLVNSMNTRIEELPNTRSRYAPARYNRDSLLHNITTAARYVTSLAVQRTRRRQSSLSVTEEAGTGEFLDGSRMAVAGDIIYIPPPQGTLSEKAPVLESITMPAGVAQHIKIWPEECTEAVIYTEISQSENKDNINPYPCLIVEVVSPGGSSSLLSSEEIEKACQKAIRQVALKLKAGD